MSRRITSYRHFTWLETPLIRALASRNPRVSEKAKEILMKIGEPAIKRLLEIVEEKGGWLNGLDEGITNTSNKIFSEKKMTVHSSIRKQAIEILGDLHESRALDSFIKALSDDNVYIRRASANALGKLKDKKAVEPLIQLLIQEWSKKGSTVRDSVASSLDQIGYFNSSPKKSVDTLIDSLEKNSDKNDFSRELLTLLKRAEKLGIDFPERFNFSTLQELVRNREANKPDNRPLAVILYPKSDWNGASAFNDYVDALIGEGYRVMYYEAESDAQVIQFLNSATGEQQAELIVFGGHGEQGNISFGNGDSEEAQLDLKDENQLITSGVSHALKDNGQIIIKGCSTGEGREQGNNMVNLLRRVFPQASPKGIWGPTVPTSIRQFIFDENHRLIKVEYSDGDDHVYAHAPALWRGE